MWIPKIPFLNSKEPEVDYRVPVPTAFPKLEGGEMAGLYKGARSGGDFFDVVTTGSRVIFVLLDISGKRAAAFHIAAHVQDAFREQAPLIFDDHTSNEAEGITELLLHINRTIINTAGGAHLSAGFLGCFSLQLGTLFYANAGHTPGLLKDSSGVSLLQATGLPLGLFSHATQDAQMCVLEPGATLLLVSRGITECKRQRREFGVESVRDILTRGDFQDAKDVCSVVLAAAVDYAVGKSSENDLTTLALVRSVAKASRTVSAGS